MEWNYDRAEIINLLFFPSSGSLKHLHNNDFSDQRQCAIIKKNQLVPFIVPFFLLDTHAHRMNDSSAKFKQNVPNTHTHILYEINVLVFFQLDFHGGFIVVNKQNTYIHCVPQSVSNSLYQFVSPSLCTPIKSKFFLRRSFIPVCVCVYVYVSLSTFFHAIFVCINTLCWHCP